jgi:hypothetical protein
MTPTPMVVVVSVAVAVVIAMMVKPTIATPHHRTTNETETEIEIEFTTRKRMRMRMQTERSIPKPYRTRTPTRILSRTPKLAGSAHRAVLRPVLAVHLQSVGAGRAIMALAVLDKTRGCIQMRADKRGAGTEEFLKSVAAVAGHGGFQRAREQRKGLLKIETDLLGQPGQTDTVLQ